jgi:hypothetical protein
MQDRLIILLVLFNLVAAVATGHEHLPVTHEFGKAVPVAGPTLKLHIVDSQTGIPLAARFTMEVDGEPYDPRWLDEHGISFTSIHVSKKQRYTAFYSKGSGAVSLSLPEKASRVSVSAARGFHYRLGEGSVDVRNGRGEITIELSRW